MRAIRSRCSVTISSARAALYGEAKKKDWTVISMKNDWRRIFAFEN
jgi:hypothetical protein